MKKEYLGFITFTPVKPRRTIMVEVIAKESGARLGLILWNTGWRQYVFEPEDETFFSKGCLDEISEFIQDLMRERRVER